MELDEEYLKCPICINFPTKEIFQCENGHSVCSECISKVNLCPICRVPYGINMVRNRALEEICEKVRLPCSNKEFGCIQTMKIHETNAHNKICLFRSVNLCPSLGYAECKSSIRSGDVLIEHLQEEHGVLLSESNISNTATLSTTIYKDCPILQPKYFMQYMKAMVKGKLAPILLVVKIASDFNGQYLNCAVIYLGNGSVRLVKDVMAKIDIDVMQQWKKMYICTLTRSPVHFKRDVEDAEIIQYFSMPLTNIRSQLDPSKGSKFDLIVAAELASSKCMQMSIHRDFNLKEEHSMDADGSDSDDTDEK